MLLVAFSYRHSPPAPYLASYIRFGIPTNLSSAWQVFSCINWYHSCFWGYKFAFAVTQLLVLWSVFLNMIKAGAVIYWRIDFFFPEVLLGRWARKQMVWSPWSLSSSFTLHPWEAWVQVRPEKAPTTFPYLCLDTRGCISESHSATPIM